MKAEKEKQMMKSIIKRYRKAIGKEEYVLLHAEISLNPDGPEFHLYRGKEASEILAQICGEAGEEWIAKYKSRFTELLKKAAAELNTLIPGDVITTVAPQTEDMPVYGEENGKEDCDE